MLNHPLIAQRYFFPMRADLPDAWEVAVDGARLGCFRHVFDPAAPTMLHFHGNGEIVGDYLPWFPALLAGMGFNTVLVEYRGYGASTGVPRLGEMLHDGPQVLRALNTDPARVVAFGRSVGSIFAIHLASQVPDLGALVLESGIADPLERLLLRVSPAEMGTTHAVMEQCIRTELDHQTKLQGYAGPTLVLHAKHDHLVGIAHGRALADWAPQSTSVFFDRGDHNSIFALNREAYVAALREFLVALQLQLPD